VVDTKGGGVDVRQSRPREVSLDNTFPTQVTKVLDHQPYACVVFMGVILGLGLGIPGFFYLRSPVWILLWGGLFVALWRMAAYAEPVFEETIRWWLRPGPRGCETVR
jgi:hypothetical protein